MNPSSTRVAAGVAAGALLVARPATGGAHALGSLGTTSPGMSSAPQPTAPATQDDDLQVWIHENDIPGVVTASRTADGTVALWFHDIGEATRTAVMDRANAIGVRKSGRRSSRPMCSGRLRGNRRSPHRSARSRRSRRPRLRRVDCRRFCDGDE